MTQAQPPFDPRNGPWPTDMTTPTGRQQTRPSYSPIPDLPGEVVRMFDIPSPDPRQPAQRVYVVREPAPPRSGWKCVVFMLVIVALIIAVMNWRAIGMFFENMAKIGQGNVNNDIKGLLSVGLIGAMLIAVCRICVSNQKP